MAAGHDPKGVEKNVSFGTTQERKMFPHYYAPDRLGIEISGNNVLKSSLSTRPMSSRGYVMGARTAPRFPLKAKTMTPGPGSYGPFLGEERSFKPAHVPFSSSSPRFPTRIPEKDLYPGPGSYNIEQPLNRKFTWPMKFGAPDWAALPAPPQKMAKMQVQMMTLDKIFRKNQGRVAYLKSYHS